ncbi:phytoene desaturase family protein [Candidatus Chlorohelix sp.]|uniref:phytoene desaturase family protein n=1 Tax=Candidatus Chlorohelix sp. TaxID=3139201 RepID=UPI0030334811
MATVTIVGGGMGGLATAIRLAATGHKVQIFEKNAQVGGKLNLMEKEGYRWDTGPSLITMPFVYDDLFRVAGRDFKDYVELVPVEPITRYFYPDGAVFDASDSLASMTFAIEKLSPPDVANYYKYMAYSRRLYDLTAEVFLFNGFNNLSDLRQMRLSNTFKIDPFRTVHQANTAFFKDKRLVQLFDRYATYNGSSPYRAPATLNVIPFVELGLGGWYVRDGLYKLAQAYLKLAQELGVEVRTGVKVERILTCNGKASGLRLESGEEVAAEVVISNADVNYTNRNLLGQKREGWRKYTGIEPSCSGFVLFLGLKRQYKQLRHHNILFSHDYQKEFADIFERKVPPQDPTIYICWTGRTDPAHAPPGSSNLFVLTNAPYLSEKSDWTPAPVKAYRDLIIGRLQESGLEGLETAIEVERVMTPHDLEQSYNATHGAIYGLSSNNRFSAFLRPPNRSSKIKGLYYAGGSTHPGGGVPLVTLSAKIVAKLVEQDLK